MRYAAIAIMLGAVLTTGCMETGLSTAAPQAAPAPTNTTAAPAKPVEPNKGSADYMPNTVVKLEGNDSAGTVQSTLIWSEKYSQAVEKLSLLQAENRDMLERNRVLQEQMAKMQAELDQTKAALKEANTLVTETRDELSKWKESVLGFREEMRQAQKTQLDALAKVMTLLGGEMAAEPTTKPAVARTTPVKKDAAGGTH